jgi:hypothetical protein
MSQENPLTRYFRHPELHIQLPSNGRWWQTGSLDMPVNNEISVMAMSGLDDLAMKNADGLMNGDTTVRVIQSCCPSIKNAWNMPSIDTDTVLIAIRIASYGELMQLGNKCSKCNEFHDFQIDLRSILSNIKFPNYDNPIEIDDLLIFLQPSPYHVVNLNNQEIFQQQKTVIALANASLSNEEKEKILKEAIERLTNIAVKRLSFYIEKIVLPTGTSVFDKEQIQEFIDNCNQKTYNKLKDGITKKNQEYKLPLIPIKCEHCEHVDEKEFAFDPANFFVASS